MFSMADIVDLAIQIERNGEKVYRNALNSATDRSLVSLLQWLADQEVEHAEWFSELKQTVTETTGDAQLEEMGRAILLGILGNQTFSLNEEDISKTNQIKDLLDLAIEFEKDTVLFYEMIASSMEDGESLDHLNAIIEEENRHVRLLQEFLGGGDVKPDRNRSRR